MTDTNPNHALACDKNTQADLITQAKADLDALVAKKADAEAKGRKQKTLDKYTWEIYYQLRKLRQLRGEIINDAGYTGRNSNKRH